MKNDDLHYFKEVLLLMQKYDPKDRGFGAITHQYRLGAPLSEEALIAFGQKHQVVLPHDYRIFLKEMGNGAPTRSSGPGMGVNNGAGPDYGLLPLDDAVQRCDLTRPFPFPLSSSKEPCEGELEWGDEEPWPGILRIGYAGCAYFSYLVVNGPAYGTVWGADIDAVEFYCTGLSFGEWYRQWIDQLVRQLPVQERKRLAEWKKARRAEEQAISFWKGEPEESIWSELQRLKFHHPTANERHDK